MPFLTVNGITLPVLVDTHAEAEREVGLSIPAYSGRLRKSRQAVKRDISVQTTLLSASDAVAWDKLIRGRDGEVWAFESGRTYYGSKGSVLTPKRPDLTFPTSWSKFGTTSARFMGRVWTPLSGSTWTALFWRRALNPALAPDHYAVYSNGNWYKNGVSISAPSPLWLTAAAVNYGLIGESWTLFNGAIIEGTAPNKYVATSVTGPKYAQASNAHGSNTRGDQEIIVKVAADNWSAGAQCFLSKFDAGATHRSWWFGLDSAKRPGVLVSDNGGGFVSAVATADMVVTNGVAIWIKWIHDVDNGAGGHDHKFYTSTDYNPATGTGTWTQLGATVTIAGVYRRYASNTVPIEIGSFGNGAGNNFAGKTYYVAVRDGINGPIAVGFDPNVQIASGVQLQIRSEVDATAPYNWMSSMAVLTGQYMIPPGAPDYLFECTTAGTTHSSEASWNTTFNATTTETGGVVWTCRGLAHAWVDDLVLLPYSVPTSWLASLAAATTAWAIPRVTLGGTAVPSARVCIGAVSTAEFIRAAGGPRRRLTATFREV